MIGKSLETQIESLDKKGAYTKDLGVHTILRPSNDHMSLSHGHGFLFKANKWSVIIRISVSFILHRYSPPLAQIPFYDIALKIFGIMLCSYQISGNFLLPLLWLRPETLERISSKFPL